MYEQSPFTFMDFLRQRKRWHQGAYYIAFSKNLKRDLSGTAYMLLFFLSFFTVMGTASIFLSLFFPISFHPVDVCLECFILSCQLYFYWFGLIKNFNLDKYNLLTNIILFLSAPIFIRYMDICNTLAFIWALVTSKSDFHIVKKISLS